MRGLLTLGCLLLTGLGCHADGPDPTTAVTVHPSEYPTTETGKYRKYVYSAVSSYFFPEIYRNYAQVEAGAAVHLKFTVHADGAVSDVSVVEGSQYFVLAAIAKDALKEAAPFKPFSAALTNETGQSYTSTYTFSVH